MKAKLILAGILGALALGVQATDTFNIGDNTSATISGGSINNTPIGQTTPAAGSFTTVTASTSISVTNATDSTSTTTGSLRTAGGLGIGKNIWIGGNQFNTIATTDIEMVHRGAGGWWFYTDSASKVPFKINQLAATNTLQLLSTGAAVTGALSATGVISASNITDSSSTTTGSLITAGGLGVAKKSYFGDSLNVAAPGTISVGSGSTTSAGLIAGYGLSSGIGAIWSTAVVPSTTNYALAIGASNTYLNGTGTTNLVVNGVTRATLTSASFTHVGDMIYDKTITTAGTTGAQTINKTTGRVNFAAAATSLVVTNSLVTSSSIIHCTVATNDTTMKSAACVPGSGSFTMYANTAPTAETAVAFTVTN